jgi:ParB family chromosome partitioning protein
MRPNFKNFAKRGEGSVPTPPRPVHPVDVITDAQPIGRLLHLPLALIRPNPNQPRKRFDQEALDELAASIREHGILQPILVRKDPHAESYIIIAGERRFRSATALGLEKIPAIIRPEENHREVALIENLQRQNLSPIEEAEGFLELKQSHGFTDETLAKVLGKPRTTITETIGLTRLPERIKEECRTCDIGTKRQLLSVLRAGSDAEMFAVWEALKSGAVKTVREIQAHTRKPKGRPQNYRFSYRPKGGSFTVNVSFSKRQATAEEVKKALLDAAKSLKGNG